MSTYIADNISSVKLSNEQWLVIIDELDELIAELRYAKQNKQRADELETLAQFVYDQLKNGPVPDPEPELTDKVEVLRKSGVLPSLSDIPTLD